MTRLLILADMVDVHILMEKVNRAQEDLAFVRGTTNQPELMEGMRRLEESQINFQSTIYQFFGSFSRLEQSVVAHP